MITTTAAPAADTMSEATFHYRLAVACVLVAFLGFAPTYFVPLARGTLKVSPIVHMHGALFFAWTLLLAYQARLVATGRLVRHRALGLIGISLVTAMVILGVMTAVLALRRATGTEFEEAARTFMIVPVTGMIFFATCFALAIVWRRNRDAHKRLMLLSTVGILEAAVARWFMTFLAPPGAVGPPTVEMTVAPALIAASLIVAAMVFDWRTRGRPHAVWMAGGIALLALKVLQMGLATTPGWHAAAHWLASLGG